MLRRKYPEIESTAANLPDRQKELIDARFRETEENPERILSTDSLLMKLDSDQKNKSRLSKKNLFRPFAAS